MKAILIDDEQLALEILTSTINKLNKIETIGKFTDPEQALAALEKVQVDLIFLDIDMGQVHGVVFARELMEKFNYIDIVFVTAFPEFALEAFEVSAVDYLLKPVRIDRLDAAITKIQKRMELYRLRNEAHVKQSLHIQSFGSFVVHDFKENIVKWRTKKVKELFAFLWHHLGTPVHKAKIIHALWENIEVEKAYTLLHTTVYQLRKTLKSIGMPQAITLVNDSYLLSGEINSDLHELEQILMKQNTHVDDVQRILDLYIGDYLEEEDYLWIIAKQQALQQEVLMFFERFMDGIDENEAESLMIEKCLEKMLFLNAYNEDYMINLMKYYVETKNKKKIQMLYKSIKESVEGELGLSIPNELEHLYKQYVNKKHVGK